MIKTLMRTTTLVLLLSIVGVMPMAQQTSDERSAWNRPFEPFHLIGNIYYVGAAGVSAFLIVTPAGSILLDGGLPETASQIAGNVTKLGFPFDGCQIPPEQPRAFRSRWRVGRTEEVVRRCDGRQQR